jgi:hypothetical protein
LDYLTSGELEPNMDVVFASHFGLLIVTIPKLPQSDYNQKTLITKAENIRRKVNFMVDTTVTATYLNQTPPMIRYNGLPSFPVYAENVSVFLHNRNDDLSAIVENVKNSKTLTISFPPNWVGGVLKLFDIKQLPGASSIQFIGDNSSLYERWTSIVNKYLMMPNPDKWECQEELEKDKSTKPFASD